MTAPLGGIATVERCVILELMQILAPLQGAGSPRTVYQGLRSLRSLNPWLLSYHAFGMSCLGCSICTPEAWRENSQGLSERSERNPW
jgi:hypothetical protein